MALNCKICQVYGETQQFEEKLISSFVCFLTTLDDPEVSNIHQLIQYRTYNIYLANF